MLLTWLQQTPGWVLPGASLDLNFAAGTYYPAGVGSLLTTTRAQTVSSYALTSTGSLTAFAANTPRITDVGLLVEQAATNLALNSNDMTQAASWTLTNTTALSNQVTGPDGATSGGLLADNSTNGNHNAFAAFTAVSGTTYTSSIYLKAGTATVAQLTFASGQFSGAGYANFNLSNGTVSSTGGTLVASGIVAASNGFYRCWIAATATASAVANASVILTNNNDSATRSPSYAGSGQALNPFGAQIEASAFPTSYIPTTTVTVARAADNIAMAGAALTAALNAKAAYIATNSIPVASVASSRLLDYSGGSLLFLSSSTTVRAQDSAAHNVDATIGGAGTVAGVVKSAFGLDNTSMTAISNGGTKATQATSAWATSATGTVTVGNRAALDRALNGYISRLAFGTTKGQFDGLTA